MTTTIKRNIDTYGLVTELKKSQTENLDIIQKHWKNFNDQLRKHKLNQSGGNWEKYGITFKTDDKYYYLASIPLNNQAFPDHFTHLKIPKGDYKVFTHKGSMKNIKHTINEIYRIILPKSGFSIEDHSKTGFFHFEKYDFRFRWNNPDSIIDIYLPSNTDSSCKKREIYEKE